MPIQIDHCRICKNPVLKRVLDLGEQDLTGVFPAEREQAVTRGPLRLVKCHGGEVCGLLQLEHSYDLNEMYGENYGYRSGVNRAMVRHLDEKIQKLLATHPLPVGALVIDIGSNDSTTLQSYPSEGLNLLGVDPTGCKFREHYPNHIGLIPDFFSAELIAKNFPDRKASVITSFSMLYDLEDPLGFMRDVHTVLEDGGIWIFEQSYMPTMLAMNSYDTVCHEHLEYYAIKQIVWMADRVGFSLIDVELNDVNGGSFSVTARKTDKVVHTPSVLKLLAKEKKDGLDALKPYEEFADRVRRSKQGLLNFLQSAKQAGKKVCALGASTKGNVLLQYCELSVDQIAAVGEINADKYGKLTPGTLIPIVPEQEILDSDWDYHLILPWHFRKFFLGAKHLKGKILVFPLPEIQVYTV